MCVCVVTGSVTSVGETAPLLLPPWHPYRSILLLFSPSALLYPPLRRTPPPPFTPCPGEVPALIKNF